MERAIAATGYLAGVGVEALHQATRQIGHGRLRRGMALMAIFAAIVSSFEAYVQHMRGAFRDWLMWTPIWLTPPMVLAAVAAIFSRRAARQVLPWISGAMVIDGALGFGLHVRGVHRMPGGFRMGEYNVTMGPPLFAPLLLTTVGILGLLAAFLRPERLPRPERRP